MNAHVPSFQEFVGALGSTPEEHRIFEVGEDQTYTFHGYSVSEIADLYALHQNHMKYLTEMAQSLQTGADAVRYRPVGPEDIDHEDRPEPLDNTDIRRHR
jgi:hypothetical protein